MEESSKYDIKDLDAESVSLAIDGCLPYLADEEIQSLVNCFKYTPGDIKPLFLVADSELKYLKDVTMFYRGTTTVIHSFYQYANSSTIYNNIVSLKENIEKIKGYVNKWDEILEEKPEEITEIKEITLPPPIPKDETEKYSVTEDFVGVDENGNELDLPKGEYEILGIEGIDGETYLKIKVRGKIFLAKYVEGRLVPFHRTSIKSEEAVINDDIEEIAPNEVTETVTVGSIASFLTIFRDIAGSLVGVSLIDGKYYKVELDENGVPKGDKEPELINPSYTVVLEDTTITTDGSEIKINKGRYEVIAIKTLDGKKYGLILINGKYCWVEIDKDNKIIPNTEVEIKENSSIIVTDPVILTDNSTNEDVEIKPGKYEIIDYHKKVDKSGEAIIEINDSEYAIVDVSENGLIEESGEIEPLTPTEVEIETGVEVIVSGKDVDINPGNYTVIAIQEINNEKYGLVLVDGEYCWVRLDENNMIVPNSTTIPVNNFNYTISNDISFILQGETITIPSGEYQVLKVMPLSDGGYAECILVNDKNVWIYFDHNGNITNTLVEIPKGGIYTINSQLEIIDELGKNVGTTTQYNYRIYAVRYDQYGNIVAIRISPPGYPEEWVIVRTNNMDLGTYTDLDYSNSNPNNTVQYSFFEKHKTILGCLIGLATVLGGAIIYKKKKGSKEKEESYTIDDGEYPVFEEELDNDGNVSAVRISNEEDGDDYWMEV